MAFRRPNILVVFVLLAVIMLAIGSGLVSAQSSIAPVQNSPYGRQTDRLPVSVYVTTGDAQWDPRYQPEDSQATISALFEHLAKTQAAGRIYWRGQENQKVLEHYELRKESTQRYDYWANWEQLLTIKKQLNLFAVKEAHKDGMKIYSMDALFDFGAPGSSLLESFPFFGEDKFRIAHPQWIPINRPQTLSQPGPLEFSYPQVRSELLSRFSDQVIKYGYDGLFLYTYFENYSTRYEDEFGYNDPVVLEYQRRYGVDIRTQPFDQPKWNDLRGEYLTQFLMELHNILSQHGKRLTVALSARDPDHMQDWPQGSGYVNSSMRMDWRTWVTKGYVDEICIMGGSQAQQIEYAKQVIAVRMPTVEVNLATEDPYHPQLHDLAAQGVRFTGYSAPYSGVMERFSFRKSSADDLHSQDWKERAQALADIATAKLAAPTPDLVAALAADPNVLVRRTAVEALGAMKAQGAKPVIEMSLLDPETSVRVEAIKVLSKLGDRASVDAILAELPKDPTFMVKEEAVRTLTALKQDAVPSLLGALKSTVPETREVAARTIGIIVDQRAVPILVSLAREDKVETVRFYALEALLNFRVDAVYPILVNSLDDSSTTVQLAAVQGIARLHALLPKALRDIAFAKLKQLWSQYGTGSTRPDAAWGWRAVGTALEALGEDGKSFLTAMREQTSDAALAWHAYITDFRPQAPDRYTRIRAVEDANTHNQFAPKIRNPNPNQ